MGGLIYDDSALVAAARADARMWTLHRGALERNEAPLVLAPVLARAWGATAGRPGPLPALLRGCSLVDFPVAAAYDVGRLLARSGTTDIVAGAVVLAAVTTRSALVTAVPAPLHTLAEALGVRLALTVV